MSKPLSKFEHAMLQLMYLLLLSKYSKDQEDDIAVINKAKEIMQSVKLITE
jgi:hypothetical protein